MAVHTFDCDRNRLQLLLSSDLDVRSRRETERHLDNCDSCQETLLSLAGERDWWDEASQFLDRDVHDPGDRQQQFGHSALWDDTCTESDCPSAEFVLSHFSPSDNPAMLGRLGDYEILEVIGQGGMGVVLKGYDGELNRYVAVKVLLPHLAASGAARKRFAREAQAAAAIVHPNVLAIHAVESSEALPYLVMPLVSGETLQHRIDREGPLGLKDILRIGLQTSQALAAAHSQGLVHRDVKPANILLDGSVDRVLLSDFGLARAADDATLTRSGVVAGTPHYMSPEQVRGEPVDHRSDLFSLGSVLFAMSTGRPPFRAETPLGIARKIDDAAVRAIHEINSDLPEWLDTIRSRLMSRLADSRLPTAADAAALLEQSLAHVQQPDVSPLPGVLARQMHRKRPRVVVWLLGVAVCLVVLVATQLPKLINSHSAEPVDGRDTAGVAADNSGAVASDIDFTTRWDDDVTLEIQSFDADLLEFEKRPEMLRPAQSSTAISNP